MLAGLSVAIVLFAQAAAATGDAAQVYGPSAPAAPKPVAAAAKPAGSECTTGAKDSDSREIVVCAPKPQGYRIDPDVLAARKARKQQLAGRPKPPNTMKDNSCTVVGPAPCIDAPMINLLAAAATVAQMADRLSKGQEIGSMFVTEPQQSEYQFYLEAKKEREAKEAEAAAKAKARQAKAAQPPKAEPAAAN